MSSRLVITRPSRSVSVSIDITHTWIGDLKVELLKDNAVVSTLHANTGGSQQNLVVTKTLSATELGVSAGKGNWSLKVVDNAAQDTGTIKSFKLAFGL